MEKEIKNEISNISFNPQEIITNNNMTNNDVKEFQEISNIPNFNSENTNINISIKNNIKELNDHNDSTKNHTSIQNTDDFSKKINNKKVNSTLNDIYSSITNINELNKRVKSLLSNRPIIHKSIYDKRKINSQEKIKYIPNTFKREAKDITKIVNSRRSSIQKSESKDLSYIPNNINKINVAPQTTKYYYKYDINKFNSNSKKSEKYNSTDRKINNNSNNKSNKKKISQNNSYQKKQNSQTQKSLNYTYGFGNEFTNSIPGNNNKTTSHNNNNNNSNINNNYYKNIIQKNISKNNDEYSEYNENEKISNNYSIISSVRNSILTNINCSSIIIEDGLKNEKDIKIMKMKLKKEQKKLKYLEEEKHKLLKEEKIRRKIIMENIKKKNKIKKKSIIKQYKKKINLIKKLQVQNIDEIMQLEKKKKIDENKLKKIKNMLNDEENININIFKKNNKKHHNRNINRNNELDNNINDDNNLNINKNSYKYFTFSSGFVKNEDSNIAQNYINNEDNNLTNDNQYINTLYDLSSSENNSNNNKSIISISNNFNNNISNRNKEKNSQKKVINYFDKNGRGMNMINKNENRYNYLINLNNGNNEEKNNYNFNYRNINLDNIFIQNTDKNKKNSIFNSDSRKYDKNLYNHSSNNLYKKYSSPKVEIPSYIQARVNKYNYYNMKKSNSSKRISGGQMSPYSFDYNFNYKYNNNIPSNVSNKINMNYYDNNDRGYSHKKERKKGDLNFKYIFFDNE